MDLKSIAEAYQSIQEKKLDPVGKEDGDVDNDGDKDSSDSYLMKRRAAIKKAMKKEEAEKEETEVVEHHQKDADGKVIEHEDEAPGTPSSVEEERTVLEQLTENGREIDSFEAVISYLIDERFAESWEEAQDIMVTLKPELVEEVYQNQLNELNKQERMETAKRGGGGVGKRFAKKTIAKNKAGTSKRGYDHRGTGNVGRRNIQRFENEPVKRKEGSLDKKRRQTFKTVTVLNPKAGYSKKSDATTGSGKKLVARKLGRFGSDMKRDYGPQKPEYAGNTSRDAAQSQRATEHKKRRGVKTKGTVASDIKKSLKETNEEV